MKNRFDLEQEIMGCWGITDDLQQLLELIDDGYYPSLSPTDTDGLANIVMGLKNVYQMKFEKMFNTFGQCIPQLKDSIEDDEDLGVPWEVDELQMSLRLNDVTPAEWDSVR